MQKATINKRLSAIEAAVPVKMPNVAIILQWPDGHCTHNGQDFADMAEALDVLRPEEHIPVQVVDYSQPQTKAQGGQTA